MSVFSGDVARFFFDDLRAFLSIWDVLWFGLAVVSAWRIPQRVDHEAVYREKWTQRP